MATAVTTRSYDNARTGANLSETVLTQASVRTHGIRAAFDLVMEDDARGSEGMTLIVPGLTMADGMTHNVAFIATHANKVFAFDCDTGMRLWMQRVGNPVRNNGVLDMWNINDGWGILSTPVIDLDAQALYAVAWHSPDGTAARASYFLHALSLIDGHALYPALPLADASYKPPGLPMQTLKAVARKQRCGLLLTDIGRVKTVFIGAGSFNEDARSNQGWVIAVDVTAAPTLSAAWASSARYGGSGIWQAGQGLVADAQGFVYGMTGNGGLDGISEFGECFFKLQYTPAAADTLATLQCVDYFAPFTDTARVGGDPTLADVSLIPGYDAGTDDVGRASNANGYNDMDLGSGGPVYISQAASGYSRNVLMGAGKDGIVYVVDADNMGAPQLADFAPDRIQQHVYGKLLSPPVWFTYYNPTLPPAPDNAFTLDTLYVGKTHHQHSTPVFYNSPVHGPMVFTWGENGNLRAWRLNADFTLTYLACSAEMASADCAPPGGMPGGMLTLSANGSQAGTALIIACIPYGDANKTISPGRLLIYDAENFGTFGDGADQIVVLWDSERWADTASHNKFNVATVANGKVFRPTYDGRVRVYELAKMATRENGR